MNVISVVENLLGVSDDEFLKVVDEGAPTRILYYLEDQITLFQINGSSNNLTIMGENFGAVTLQVPGSSLTTGITLSASGDEPLVHFGTDDASGMSDASITLPGSIFNTSTSDEGETSIPSLISTLLGFFLDRNYIGSKM